jgi:hypothetical protein
MTDKPDILERLKRWAEIPPRDIVGGKADWVAHLKVDLVEAIADIDHLRRLAGAVSRGESHAEIRDKARKG